MYKRPSGRGMSPEVARERIEAEPSIANQWLTVTLKRSFHYSLLLVLRCMSPIYPSILYSLLHHSLGTKVITSIGSPPQWLIQAQTNLIYLASKSCSVHPLCLWLYSDFPRWSELMSQTNKITYTHPLPPRSSIYGKRDSLLSPLSTLLCVYETPKMQYLYWCLLLRIVIMPWQSLLFALSVRMEIRVTSKSSCYMT